MLFSWGEGVSGQLGLGHTGSVRSPIGVEAMLDREPIVQVLNLSHTRSPSPATNPDCALSHA